MGKSKSTKTAARGKTAKEPSKAAAPKQEVDVSDHLPPLVLVFTVVLCSGFLFMYAFRDVFATGRNIGGDVDEAYLVSLTFVLELLVLEECWIRIPPRHFSCSPNNYHSNTLRIDRRSRIRKPFSTTKRDGSPNRVVLVPSHR